MDGDTKPLNHVKETVLKKRRNREQSAIQRAHDRTQKKRRKGDPGSFIRKPENFVWEFRQQEMDLARLKRRVKFQKVKPKNIHSKLLFVIRINGSNDMHPTTRKTLRQLRLAHIFTGVFLKTDEANLNALVKVEPYITYGSPNLRSVRELILKKGCGRVNGMRAPLTDNNIIEQALGKHGILCLEDMVHEVETVGPHFNEVNHFLLPFRLKKPEDKVLQKTKTLFKRGGDAGDRGDLINDLISKMN